MRTKLSRGVCHRHPTLINLGLWNGSFKETTIATRRSRCRTANRERPSGTRVATLASARRRIYQNQGVFDVILSQYVCSSILDLEPDTAYEARFVMSDPDGFLGQNGKTVTKTVTVRTRPNRNPIRRTSVHVYQRVTRAPRSSLLLTQSCAPITTLARRRYSDAGRPRVKPAISFWCMPGFTNIIRSTTSATVPSCDYSRGGNLLSDRTALR